MNDTRPRETILVADDESPVRDFLYNILRDDFSEVILAADGNAAIRCARDRMPSVILMDMYMPGRTGLQAAQELRLDPEFRDVPILLISGLTTDAAAARAQNFGATDFIFKPFDGEDLRRRIRGHAATARRARDLRLSAKRRQDVEAQRDREERAFIDAIEGNAAALGDVLPPVAGDRIDRFKGRALAEIRLWSGDMRNLVDAVAARAGRLEFAPRTFALPSFVASAAHRLAPLARDWDVRIDMTLNQAGRVRTDPEVLERVLASEWADLLRLMDEGSTLHIRLIDSGRICVRAAISPLVELRGAAVRSANHGVLLEKLGVNVESRLTGSELERVYEVPSAACLGGAETSPGPM